MGCTAYSKFKIFIEIYEIKKVTQLALLINQTFLIIWNETPINYRYYFEAIDSSLKYILLDNKLIEDCLFGEKKNIIR